MLERQARTKGRGLMVIDGLTPMLVVVVLLILVAAVLFALNRRAVAARTASIRLPAGNHGRRASSATASDAAWRNASGSYTQDWAWDDGRAGQDATATTQQSIPAPTWPLDPAKTSPEATPLAVDASVPPEAPADAVTEVTPSLMPALTLVPALASPDRERTADDVGPADDCPNPEPAALPLAESEATEPVQIPSLALDDRDPMPPILDPHPVLERVDPFWSPPGETVALPPEAASEAPDEPWPDFLVVDPFTEIAARDSGQDVPVPQDASVPAEQDPGSDVADGSTLLDSYRVAEDAEAKCRAIDALADEGSDLALAALQVCLDDTDPTVQLHALEAAERLLSR